MTITVTIPIPSYIPKARGRHATSKQGGNLRVRCSNRELALIRGEAKRLGLSTSQFVRWAALRVAEELERQGATTREADRSR